MVLRFQSSVDDYLVFLDWYNRGSAVYRRSRRLARWQLCIWMLPVLAIQIAWGGFNLAFFLIVLAAIALWYAFYPKLFDWHVRRYATKALRESKSDQQFGMYEVTLDERGIRSSGPAGESFMDWTKVQRAELTRDYLFVLLIGPSGYPIKVSDVGEVAAMEAYRWIRQHVQASISNPSASV